MRIIQIIISLQYLISLCQTQFKPRILNASVANIKKFPFIGFVSIKCGKQLAYSYTCGSSIIHQKLILTAAHCLEDCIENTTDIVTAFFGNTNKLKGSKVNAVRFFLHDHYDGNAILNDIAIIKLKNSVKFTPKTNRIALLPDPPYHEEATVAGWGLIDEVNKIYASKLRSTKQKVLSNKLCEAILNQKGVICVISEDGVASSGDSGSPLVVRGYIQIGLVSYKGCNTELCKQNLVVYTDVGHYYWWIQAMTYNILCCE